MQGRLTIKNRMDSAVAITMRDEYKAKMPFGDTSSYLLIPPCDNAHIYYGFGWRWKEKDEALFYRYIENNTTVLGDTLDVPRLRIGLRRQGLIGSGMVVRLR